LEAVEVQDSAFPYHDWNQRITIECYAPNAHARILDGTGRIAGIFDNYSRISFNVGPTLLAWMEHGDPETYGGILAADARSRRRFSGHGSAIAQAYNHAILPLCNARDKRTQVIWGIEDFRHRFGREPEGMWLPETAVDLESLEILAQCGIRFTLLAPSQALEVRRRDHDEWRDVSDGSIDTRRAYRVELPSGRAIHVFFYDGAVSQAIAFQRLLTSGNRFARRLLDGFDDRGTPQLVNVATDGETYGHHHPHGDMALAWALHHIEHRGTARLTNYGEFLDLCPAEHEVRIREHSSWSCAHGLGRWREACGCASEIREGWHQRWRGPLREALDWLRDRLAPRFEQQAARYLRDPWEARDGYIRPLLDRRRSVTEAFLEQQAGRRLDDEERTQALKLLELQRQAMLMYTSCGWFFEELSRIETVQILRYADRALQLGEELFREPLELEFVARLERAPSNVLSWCHGGRLYQERVRPSRVDAAMLAANYAAGLLFHDSEPALRIAGFESRSSDRHLREADDARLLLGRLQLRSRVTLDSEELSFAFVHSGDHDLAGGVTPFRDEATYRAMAEAFGRAWDRQASDELTQLFARHFGEKRYTLQSLLRDEQRRILDRILQRTLREVEAAYRRLYAQQAPLVRFLKRLDAPPPRALRFAAELVLNNDIQHELHPDRLDVARLAELLEEARSSGVRLEADGLGFAARRALETLARRLAGRPGDILLLQQLARAVDLVLELPFEVDLNAVQNVVYRLLFSTRPAYRQRAGHGEPPARHWLECFDSLVEKLHLAPQEEA
jgi:hypothetical protein